MMRHGRGIVWKTLTIHSWNVRTFSRRSTPFAGRQRGRYGCRPAELRRLSVFRREEVIPEENKFRLTMKNGFLMLSRLKILVILCLDRLGRGA